MMDDAGRSVGRAVGVAAVVAAAVLLLSGGPGLAVPKIYIDDSGIAARTDLTGQQKEAVLVQMMNTIKANLDEAFGACNTSFTDNANQADRSVGVSNTAPVYRDSSNEYYRPWGQRDPGSTNGQVFLGRFMDHHGSSFKNGDGSWNTDRLGTALGNVAAHELVHTYCYAHCGGAGNKMQSHTGANELAGTMHLGPSAERTLRANKDKPPCYGTTNHMLDAYLADFWDGPHFALGLDEEVTCSGFIDVSFGFGGPLASMFAFGWWGGDTDGGVLDGNEWGDFYYKSSMTGTDEDAETIGFMDGWHTHFVLQGLEGTPYEGMLFDVEPADMGLSDTILRPDGELVGRQMDLSWDVNGDMVPDVTVTMSTQCYGAESPVYSGFTIGPAPPPAIGEAKRMFDGLYVVLTDCAVSAVFPDQAQFYVQSADGSAGICVDWPGPPPPEDAKVDVDGKLATGANGERKLTAWSVSPPTGSHTPKPVGMNNRAVGGGGLHYVPALQWASGQEGVFGGAGLNNVGLLITTWGEFTEEGPNTYVLNDGSNMPVKCVLPAGVVVVPGWRYMCVTGVLSCEIGLDGLSPVLRARRQADIVGYF